MNKTPESSLEPARKDSFRLSLRSYLGLVTIAMLAIGLLTTALRLHDANRELAKLRAETGHLTETSADQVAAARIPSDQPLTYRMRLRVPDLVSDRKSKFRLAYSSVWPRQAARPRWFGAVKVPPGESVATVRVLQDPRDDQWKIAAVVTSTMGSQRMATGLIADHVAVFRESHEVISVGIPRGQTVASDRDQAIRVLDERWLVGEGSLMLYGDKPPESDQIGVYAELQPDNGTL